jgi:hypothetical protein
MESLAQPAEGMSYGGDGSASSYDQRDQIRFEKAMNRKGVPT